ncbi:glycosyltransferase [Marinobacter sp. R17]|uniref:glycosyltransferase n=1 Tax=Marinobacter sp. R17 TaxID=2484250 RepID=UPI000F4CA501|nr:glycosyltransferase [Marinobacter sp. R17]ROT98390.1 glycosyltransferase [Marinobacter sp. R17]
MSSLNFPKVAIIVPAYNEEKYIGACLESLLNLKYPKDKVEILVVDNGSADRTVNIAASYGVKVLKKENTKVGGVRNFGVASSSSEIVAFIDADCVAKEGWLSTAVNWLDNPKVGAVGGVYNLRVRPSWVEKAWVLGTRTTDTPTKTLPGGSFLMRRALFEELGGFDSNINAGEDSKLSYEIGSAGYGLWLLKDCSVVHLGYPNSIGGFAKRQFWHSSSYLKSNVGFKDKTFIASLLFTVCCAVFLLALVLGNASAMLLSLMVSLIICLTFTAKRVLFGNYDAINWKYIIPAVFLDYVYFISRMSGLLFGAVKDPFKR